MNKWAWIKLVGLFIYIGGMVTYWVSYLFQVRLHGLMHVMPLSVYLFIVGITLIMVGGIGSIVVTGG